MKKSLLLALACLMLIGFLAGCSGTDKRLYGYWADESGENMYGFGTDGKGYVQMFGFTLPVLFTMKGDSLYVLYSEEGDPETDEGALEYGVTFFGDDELILELPKDSGSVTRYKRQSSSSSQ